MNPSTAHPAGSARPRDSPRWRLGPIQFLTHDSIIGPAETDNTSAIPGGGVVRPRLLRAGRRARGNQTRLHDGPASVVLYSEDLRPHEAFCCSRALPGED